jgi:hypothetical protein
MAYILASQTDRPRARCAATNARVQTPVLVLVFLVTVAVVGAIWLYQAAHRGPVVSSEPTGPQLPVLSDSTLGMLQKLDGPVEIRFYSVLDPATVGDSLIAFAGRVDQLLAAYQQAAGDKIRLTRIGPQSGLNPNVAAADGVQVFNLDKGEASCLGIALALKGRRETLARLSPEWESALEADLTRALVRLQEAPRPVPVAGIASVAVSQINTNAVQEVKALIPNLSSVSVEEGTRILREAAVKEFTAAAKEMEAQVKEAEQRLTQAQNSGSAADQQAAMKHLEQVQAEQTEKLKQIAARSKTQVDALQQIKATR